MKTQIPTFHDLKQLVGRLSESDLRELRERIETRERQIELRAATPLPDELYVAAGADAVGAVPMPSEVPGHRSRVVRVGRYKVDLEFKPAGENVIAIAKAQRETQDQFADGGSQSVGSIEPPLRRLRLAVREEIALLRDLDEVLETLIHAVVELKPIEEEVLL